MRSATRPLVSWLVILLAVPLALYGASEVSVKSLAGPPSEFDTHRLPSADELVVSTNLLTIDRNADTVNAAGVVYTNFSATQGQGFSLVQVTTAYPAFGPATFTAPNGTRYEYNGSTLRCNSGPCGSSQAHVLTESFSNSSGGVMVLSVSGGEVTGGSWQLAEQGPIALPAQGIDAARVKSIQLDSAIAFDDNVVNVTVEPDPCLLSSGDAKRELCPVLPDDQLPLTLVEGVAPVLSLSISAPELSGRDAMRGIELTALRVTVTERQSERIVHKREYSLGELAGLAQSDAGASLIELPRLGIGGHGVRLDIEGIVEGVGPIERTAYYYLPILPRSHRLTGAVDARLLDTERVEVGLGVDLLRAQADGQDTHLFAYAELWSATTGRPIAWIGGMTQPELDADGAYRLPLELDGRWLALAGEKGGDYELRKVRIHDPHTMVPIDQAAELPLRLDSLPRAAFTKVDPSILDTDRSLRVGRGDRTIRLPDPGPLPPKTNLDSGIFLVHGWCSGPAWWTGFFNPAGLVGGTDVFEDFNQSRSHDNFARRIRDQGAACFDDFFTVVAHSQGGAASVHLYANYNSLLDNGNAPRRIQTMGTPYRGSTLMDLYLAGGPLGWLIAEIFGFCGPQINLGTVGAALWSLGIPNWARDDVYYYRTQHRRPGNFWERLQFWRWRCNAASFIIPGPDDGVVSTSQGLFNNANNMGVTSSECHTGGMNHPDQRDNAARNAIMNTEGRPDPPPPLTAVCQVQATWIPCCDQNGNGYYSYTVNAGNSIPGGSPITNYRWRNGGSWGPWTTSSTYGPLLPGLPGQASNYVINVEVRDSSGATDGATCFVP
ncbi:MAG: hypothetical protein AAGC60_17070 [Acidobacteriota bacterium]